MSTDTAQHGSPTGTRKATATLKMTQPHKVSRSTSRAQRSRPKSASGMEKQAHAVHKATNATRGKSRPKWARLQHVVEAEAAAQRTISMSAPLQSLRMKSGSTCAQGGRGQGARYALLVTQPKARSTRQHDACHMLGARLHARARRSPHSSIGTVQKFAPSRAR